MIPTQQRGQWPCAGALTLLLVLAACGDSPTGPGATVSAAAALAVGEAHACALDAGGSAWCWGEGEGGRLGTGDGDARSVPTQVAGGQRFVALAAGGSTTCGLTASGQAWCWGLNDHSQLGEEYTTQGCLVTQSDGTSRVLSCSPTPLAVPTSVRFVELSVGGQFACGRTASGEVWCWGGNQHMQLGRRIPADTLQPPFAASPPVRVPGLPAVKHISAGLMHACALTSAGAAWCWGDNYYSEIDGDSTHAPVAPPRALSQPGSYASITAGGPISCATTGDGRAYCWGSDFFGSLGSGTVLGGRQAAPLPVAGGLTFAQLVPAHANYVFMPTCGLAPTGAAYCWGADTDGQLGSTLVPGSCAWSSLSNFPCSPTPVAVEGPHLTALAVGADFACGMAEDDRVWCWGANGHGQLGNGGGVGSSIPVQVSGTLGAS